MSSQTVSLHPQQKILSLPIRQLHPHPGNPNRLSKAKFSKLTGHLKRTGQYEPLVVRPHPVKDNAYQILNGHHRARALKQLGYTRADCVVFEADDEQSRLYLLSLNRLCGRDNLYKKAKLIEQLCRSYSSRDLARLIGDSKTAIEKLNALSQNQPLPRDKEDKPFLIPMTFFMTGSEHALLQNAFDKAGHDSAATTQTRRRMDALLRIARHYIEPQALCTADAQSLSE